MNMLKRFIKDEQGLETVEWVVMAALIILALVAGIKVLTTQANVVLTELNTEMTGL